MKSKVHFYTIFLEYSLTRFLSNFPSVALDKFPVNVQQHFLIYGIGNELISKQRGKEAS